MHLIFEQGLAAPSPRQRLVQYRARLRSHRDFDANELMARQVLGWSWLRRRPWRPTPPLPDLVLASLRERGLGLRLAGLAHAPLPARRDDDELPPWLGELHRDYLEDAHRGAFPPETEDESHE